MYPLPGMIHICTPEYVNIKRLEIYVCVYVLTASHGHTPITKRTINIIQPGILVYTAPGIQQYNTKHEHFGGGTQSGVSHISCMSCLKSKASAKKKKKLPEKEQKESLYRLYVAKKTWETVPPHTMTIAHKEPAYPAGSLAGRLLPLASPLDRTAYSSPPPSSPGVGVPINSCASKQESDDHQLLTATAVWWTSLPRAWNNNPTPYIILRQTNHGIRHWWCRKRRNPLLCVGYYETRPSMII